MSRGPAGQGRGCQTSSHTSAGESEPKMAPGVLRGLLGGRGGDARGKDSWGPVRRHPGPARWEILRSLSHSPAI